MGETLDDLERLRSAATPGPWRVVVTGGTDLFTGESYREVEVEFNDPIENAGLMLGEHELAEADAALIVAAVNALPDLIADARRYRALRGEPGKPRRYAPCPRCGALNGGAGQAGHYNRCTRPALAALDKR